MTELDKKETIETINRLAAEGRPFLFVINYKADRSYVCGTDETDPKEILYDFCGKSNIPDGIKPHKEGKPSLKAHPISYDEYLHSFDTVRQAIAEGKTCLVNLTCATPIDIDIDLKEVFLRSQAMYRLWIKDRFTVFSPEIFVRIENGRISSYPMKGTIDATIPDAENVILNDPKETAEHESVVKLLSDDLSLVSDNIEVRRFRYIDRIETNKGPILQTSSEIEGRLPDDWREHLGDILMRMLPGGSIAGHPKKESLGVIARAENYDRGYYTGIAGIFDGRNLDSTVLIRYMEQTPDSVIFKSGGGITADSDPRKEYEEMIRKVYVPVR